MKYESTAFYSWALDQLKLIWPQPNNLPSVIVHDREIGLMKALRENFPQTDSLLCLWHINKAVETQATHCLGKARSGDFMKLWNYWIKSHPDEYDSCKHSMLSLAGKDSKFLEYLDQTWLCWEEKFVGIYVDKLLHFGNVTTSRCEGAHSRTKSYMNTSLNNLSSLLQIISLGFDQELHEIKASMAIERAKTPARMPPVFEKLVGKVSFFAIRELMKQLKFLDDEEPSPCHGRFSKTMGLPCSHQMKELIAKQKFIWPVKIHQQWHLLKYSDKIEDQPTSRSSLSDKIQLDHPGLQRRYIEIGDRLRHMQEDKQKELMDQIECLVLGKSVVSSVLPPNVNPNTRGQPSGSSTRREKSGWEIADEKEKTKKTDHSVWVVPSQSKKGKEKEFSGHSRNKSTSSQSNIGKRKR